MHSILRWTKVGLTAFFGIAFVLALVAIVQVYRNSGTGTPAPREAGVLRVGTYNVHYISVRRHVGPWSLSSWERRKGPLNEAFTYIDADLIAFQEMESHSGPEADQDNLTLEFLLKNNPDYSAAASGDPALFPNTQPILYRTERLKMIDQGWFFFSDRPDVIYSNTFNGSYPAYASWARFTDLDTGSEFRAINIHTDFGSRSNRLQSVELVAERIAPWIDAGEIVLVLGDLNARLGDPTLKVIEDTGVTFAPVSGATYHFNRGLNLFGAIDHIGWAGDIEMASQPVVVRQKFNDVWPTDHYPYIIDLTLR